MPPKKKELGNKNTTKPIAKKTKARRGGGGDERECSICLKCNLNDFRNQSSAIVVIKCGRCRSGLYDYSCFAVWAKSKSESENPTCPCCRMSSRAWNLSKVYQIRPDAPVMNGSNSNKHNDMLGHLDKYYKEGMTSQTLITIAIIEECQLPDKTDDGYNTLMYLFTLAYALRHDTSVPDFKVDFIHMACLLCFFVMNTKGCILDENKIKKCIKIPAILEIRQAVEWARDTPLFCLMMNALVFNADLFFVLHTKREKCDYVKNSYIQNIIHEIRSTDIEPAKKCKYLNVLKKCQEEIEVYKNSFDFK